MSTLFQDLRYALRGLAKSPGFTATAVVTLALGIGANTAIFGVIRSVLLEPLPYPDPSRLVTLQSGLSVPELTDLKAMTRSFTAMGGATAMSLDLTGGPEPVKVRAALSAADLFEALGGRAVLGRPLTREDDRKGGNAVVALSYASWQRQWAGDPAIVGKSITLAGLPYTVVGVLSPEFRLPEIEADLFAPVWVVYPVAAEARGAHFLQTVFRLGPGVSPAAARADLAAAMSRLAVVHPDEDKGLTPDFVPLLDEIVGESRRPLWILAGAVGMVLLIACANLANLLLARAASRKSELAIRTALGAPRARLVRQMLTESLVLAVAGGACGMLLAVWGTQLLIARMPSALPRLENVTVNGGVAAFTLAVSILTGLVFGIAPAWKASGVRFAPGLAGPRGHSGTGRSRLRDAFVVAEIALAMVLLVGAGLLMNALWRLQTVRPGFDPKGLLALRLDLPESRYSKVPAQTAFREQVLAGLNAAPGVEAAMVSEVPLSGESLHHNFLIEGRPPVAVGDEPELYSRSIMGDYFRTMRVPLKSGRGFSARDREGAPLVGIVNESFARKYFRGASPVGARIRWAREPEPIWIEIVGVAGDVRHFGLSRDEEPAVYTPYAQSLQPWKRWMEIVVHGPGAGAGLAALVRQKVREVDPLIPVGAARTLPEIVDSSLGRERFRAQLLSIFAALALVLASVGISGVMGNSVRQRRTEIGVRLALGAAPGRVVARLLREGARLTAVGLVLGLVVSLLVSRVLSSFLFGVDAADPATYAGMAALLAAVAMLACYLPARRAAHVSPMAALRSE